MKSKALKRNLMLALCLGIGLAGTALAPGQEARDSMEVLRNDLRADRDTVVAREMNFTEKESDSFWPIYRNYRNDVSKATDRVVELVLEYADNYPNLPDQKASKMLDQYTKIETDLLKIKKKYLKKFGKVLPPSKVFRFAQVDNRLDLGTRVGLATAIPIMPASQAKPASQQH